MQGGLGGFGGLRQRDLDSAYLASLAGGPHINLNTTQEALHTDGASLGTGTAGNNDGPDYSRFTRGAVNILNVAYNAVDLRAHIYSSAVAGFDIGPDPALLPNRSTITIVADALVFLREDRTFTSVLPSSGGRFRLLRLDSGGLCANLGLHLCHKRVYRFDYPSHRAGPGWGSCRGRLLPAPRPIRRQTSLPF